MVVSGRGHGFRKTCVQSERSFIEHGGLLAPRVFAFFSLLIDTILLALNVRRDFNGPGLPALRLSILIYFFSNRMLIYCSFINLLAHSMTQKRALCLLRWRSRDKESVPSLHLEDRVYSGISSPDGFAVE